jgi:hypothetical protein
MQRGQVASRWIADQDNVATPSAIAAVGTAARHMSLAAKADAAVAPAPRLDVNPCAVLKQV